MGSVKPSAPESFDLFEGLSRTAQGRNILAEFETMARARDGVARQALWTCEDDWIVIYTTTRVQGGRHDGSFLAQLFKPDGGKGRGTFVQDDRRVCDTRAEAKARAIKWYRQHSPKWDAKHPAATAENH